MEQETKTLNKKCGKMNKGNSSGGIVYGLGFIGATIYFIQHAGTFMAGVVGVLKALVWPAMVVYKILEYLKF